MPETKPRASDAMRLADAMELPDQRHLFVQRFVAVWGGEKPPCCAIGGALIASGCAIISPVNGQVPSEQSEKASERDLLLWPTAPAECPGAECDQSAWGPFPPASVVPHIYDDHRWSRTQIADWLDTLPGEWA